VSASRGRWTSRGDLEGRGGQCHAPGLREAREAAGVTLEELAETTGYTPGQLRSIEDGQRVHRMVVSRISAALGVDHALLRGESQ
jgi:ribosome-binding protein aMBF1 (putative translation factor)